MNNFMAEQEGQERSPNNCLQFDQIIHSRKKSDEISNKNQISPSEHSVGLENDPKNRSGKGCTQGHDRSPGTEHQKGTVNIPSLTSAEVYSK